MKQLNQKMIILKNVIESLHEGVELFYEYQSISNRKNTEKSRALFMSMRDSMIQRFKYTTDLFWKVIKVCLEKQGVNTPIISPRGILREAVRVQLLSPAEGEVCMDMIESRNKTSHTYHELMAEEIAHEIPGYYRLIKELSDRLLVME